MNRIRREEDVGPFLPVPLTDRKLKKEPLRSQNDFGQRKSEKQSFSSFKNILK